ncbi:uncharacterized protein LOC144121976 [Amblyomma americanum]
MVQGDARLDESDGESTVIFQSEDGLSDATLLASPAPDISAAGPSTEDERVAPPCSLDEVSEPAARRRQGGRAVAVEQPLSAELEARLQAAEDDKRSGSLKEQATL